MLSQSLFYAIPLHYQYSFFPRSIMLWYSLPPNLVLRPFIITVLRSGLTMNSQPRYAKLASHKQAVDSILFFR